MSSLELRLAISGSVAVVAAPVAMIMLVARSRLGGAGLHQRWNDIFFALEGDATVLLFLQGGMAS